MWKKGRKVRMWLFGLVLSIGEYCMMLVIRLWWLSIMFLVNFVVFEEYGMIVMCVVGLKVILGVVVFFLRRLWRFV